MHLKVITLQMFPVQPCWGCLCEWILTLCITHTLQFLTQNLGFVLDTKIM